MMVCPACKKRFQQRLHCPDCHIVLEYLPKSDPDLLERRRRHWVNRPWGRIPVGILLSVGLYFVVYQLFLVGVSARDDKVDYQTLFQLMTVQALQFLTLFVGSMFAGAGERGGFVYGGVVGLWHGLGCTLIQRAAGDQMAAVSFVGQPIVNAAIGALGGWIGSWIWRPIREFQFPVILKKSGAARNKFDLTSSQVHWARVLTGVAVAVGGVVWADTILELALKAGEGKLSIRTSFQEQLMGLEVAALAVFAGASLAGAGTWNGSLQGAWVGILSASFLTGSRLFTGGSVQAWSLLAMMGAVLALSYLGGGFGARLFPPMIPEGIEPPRMPESSADNAQTEIAAPGRV